MIPRSTNGHRPGIASSWAGLRSTVATIAIVTTTAAVLGCGSGDDSNGSADGPNGPTSDPFSGEIIEQDSTLGPVTVKLRIAPKNPTLGDAITLDLEVTAEQQVTVEMPEFGEALGRFSIVKYVPRQRLNGDKWVGSQRYTLQAPMSGKQRIPPLRIEFLDNRPDANPDKPDTNKPDTEKPDTSTTPDSEGDGPGGIRELLTEEIPIQIASLLPEDLAEAKLSGTRGRLREPTTTTPILRSPWFWLVVALILLPALFFVIRHWMAAITKQRRISAYEAAMKRLTKLESRGLPKAEAPEMIDGWYVELSGIVRRYLEDRYNLRAPELTTEEFLQVARGSGVLSTEHRKTLEGFLRQCDSVKFARYAPEDDESREALESARSFLHDTRPQATAQEHGGAT